MLTADHIPLSGLMRVRHTGKFELDCWHRSDLLELKAMFTQATGLDMSAVTDATEVACLCALA